MLGVSPVSQPTGSHFPGTGSRRASRSEFYPDISQESFIGIGFETDSNLSLRAICRNHDIAVSVSDGNQTVRGQDQALVGGDTAPVDVPLMVEDYNRDGGFRELHDSEGYVLRVGNTDDNPVLVSAHRVIQHRARHITRSRDERDRQFP